MTYKRLCFMSLVAFGAFVTIYQLVIIQVDRYLLRTEECIGGCEPFEHSKVFESLEKPAEEPQRHSRLPDIIGIGTEKCGTGALQFYLKHHPLIRGNNKEAHFFTNKIPPDDRPINLQPYKKLLPDATDDEYIMEKTPGYFNFKSYLDIPGRIKRSVPFVKLWLVLCDPANRVYSDFVHEKNTKILLQDLNFSLCMPPRIRYEEKLIGDLANHDDITMDEYIKERMKQLYTSHILLTGLYYYHILRWHKYFDKRQLFIVDGENLIENPYEEVKKVEEFIGLPPYFKEEHFVLHPQTGFYCVQLNPQNASDLSCLTGRKGNTRKKEHLWIENNSTIQQLKEFYKPYNDKLFSYLNRTFDW